MNEEYFRVTMLLHCCWLLAAAADAVAAEGDGGLMLIPASHTSRYPLPRPPTTSAELPQVKHVEMAAGSVVIYMGGCVQPT